MCDRKARVPLSTEWEEEKSDRSKLALSVDRACLGGVHGSMESFYSVNETYETAMGDAERERLVRVRESVVYMSVHAVTVTRKCIG